MAFDEDWDLSVEELDSLEKDALMKIAERKSSSAAASASSPSTSQNPYSKPSSSKTALDYSPHKKVELLPDSVFPALEAQCEPAINNAKDMPKISVTLFLHATGNIAAKFPYHPLLVGALHKIPTASWHAKERLWMFPISSLQVAEKILHEIDGVNVEVLKLDPLVRCALTAAVAAPDLRDLYDKMPSFIESKLLPFQRDGVRFVLQHGGRALLADEMGLGKTLQALAIAACIRESWPVLVLAPSSLRLHWASMIQQWLNISSTDISVVLSQCGGSNRGGFRILYSNAKNTIQLDGIFNIISYDVVPKLQQVLLASDFKIVIADESHFLKNPQAKRTTASLPILKKAEYTILLTGTPALSRPIELFKQLEALYPEVYKNVHEYGNRYCKGGIFGLYQGASNHEELHNLMKATVMIRRLKREVLFELPVKRRQQVFLDLDEKDMKPIRALFRELEVVKNKIKACQSEEEVESLKYSEKTLINKIYNDSAEAKIPSVLDYLGTVIEAGCKFLIFAHHQPLINSVHQYLLKRKVPCIRIDGSTPPSSRQALVTEFQEKESIRAAVLSIKAGGVGLTLTAASTVIFAELSWTPGDLIQAEDRAHRIGQVTSVNVYYLIANDTADDIIWDVVQSKLENLGQAVPKLETTPSFSLYKRGEDEQYDNDYENVCNEEEFGFPASGTSVKGSGIGQFRSFFNILNGAVYGHSLWENLSAMYTATRLGIGGTAAHTQVNKTEDEQMEKHLEKLAKENPCNSLILKNYAQYLFEMLDGHENTLEVSVSQPRSSPSKQLLRSSPSKQFSKSSPSKQLSIEPFLKRCHGAPDETCKPKYPRI